MSKEAQKYYQVLKDNNDLEEVFPNSTGEWEKDKKSFIKYYNDNIKLVIDFENEELSNSENVKG